MPLIRSTLVTIPVWDCWAKAAELMRDSAVAPAKITSAIFKTASHPLAIGDNQPCTEWFPRRNFSRHLGGRDGWPSTAPLSSWGLGDERGPCRSPADGLPTTSYGWRPGPLTLTSHEV